MNRTNMTIRTSIVRHVIAGALSALVLFLAPVSTAFAQSKYQSWNVARRQVGFTNQDPAGGSLFKPGLWTPVYLTLKKPPKGKRGQYIFKQEKDGFARGHLVVGAGDGDGIRGRYHSERFDLGKLPEQTVIAYANPSSMFPDLSLTIKSSGANYNLPSKSADALSLGHHCYLVLGNRLADLNEAMIEMSRNPKERDPSPRHSGFVIDTENLPTEWFGYQPADLLILLTGNKRFVQELARDNSRIAAMSRWVRQGGHMVISISVRNPQEVAAILKSPGWQPPLPPIYTEDDHTKLSSMHSIVQWANVQVLFPASQQNPIQVAKLRPDLSAKVLNNQTKSEPPLMVRYPYGRGSVTFLAFEPDSAPFTSWNGRKDFWKIFVQRLAPRIPPNVMDFEDKGFQRGGFGGGGASDVTTQLHYEMDNFNVPQISFGWVALFIFLFILIVGPVDYLILRVVFKRLEWTWITFPTVVIVITVISYFTAYALKGNDLKINKVDLVDIDLRTALDKDMKTKSAYAYGSTWFSILSPRIQDYTVGIKPALGNWAADPAANAALDEPMVTWLGRPESGGPGGIGRQNSTSLFRRTYDYAPGAAGIKHVPIPVWTTKAFTSAWTVKCGEMPISADLSYMPKHNQSENLDGTIQSNLPVDLKDCVLIYGKHFYRFETSLAGRNAKEKKIVAIKLDGHKGEGIDVGGRNGIERWGAAGRVQHQHQQWDPGFQNHDDLRFHPGTFITRFYFFGKTMSGGSQANHMYRNLDQTWRIRENGPNDKNVRTAILVGRLERAEGSAEYLTGKNDSRLASHLWMGALPGEAKTRPALSGNLVQETYIRVFIPVRPK